MKNRSRKKYLACIGIFLIALPAIFYSCALKKENTALSPDLVHIDSIMYQHPDSALKLLEAMPIPAASDRLDHATWCLFLTQARYKNFVNQSSDSLINIASDYFMNQDDPQRKALTLYYKGALYDEWGNIEEALHYYMEAEKYAVQTEDYQLCYLIYVGIGQINAYRGLTDYAMKANMAAKHYAELSGNKVYIAGSLCYLARVYGLLNDLYNSVEYYEKALAVVKTTSDRRLTISIHTELAGAYFDRKDYNLAEGYIRKAIQMDQEMELSKGQKYLILGEIFNRSERYDSAYYYFNKAVASDNLRTTASAYQWMYAIGKEERDLDKIIYNGDKFMIYLDSIRKMDRSKAVVEMQEKYNQEKILNEKNLLKIEKDRTVRNALWISVALLAMIAVIIFLYQRALIRKQHTIRKNEEELRQFTLKIHDNELLITRNETRMKELAQEIAQNNDMQEQMNEQQKVMQDIWQQNQTLYAENRSLQENISRYSSTLQKKSQELHSFKQLSEEIQRLRDREQFLCSQLVRKTEVLNRLHQSPKYIEPAQWIEIRESIDLFYDNFTVRLSKQFPSFTESDLQVCWLIKLRLGIPEIATLLGISPTSVSKRKLRVKERIIQDLGKPFDENQTLDLWILEYV